MFVIFLNMFVIFQTMFVIFQTNLCLSYSKLTIINSDLIQLFLVEIWIDMILSRQVYYKQIGKINYAAYLLAIETKGICQNLILITNLDFVPNFIFSRTQIKFLVCNPFCRHIYTHFMKKGKTHNMVAVGGRWAP